MFIFCLLCVFICDHSSSQSLPLLFTVQSRESDHYTHTNEQITLRMAIDMHINQLRLLNKKIILDDKERYIASERFMRCPCSALIQGHGLSHTALC